MPNSKAFQGTTRKLVLGIDIGTTYSGVAYSLLEPGEVPTIREVTRYPGQATANDSRIPSILYYRPDGTVYAVGAEARRRGIKSEAEDQELFFVEWFKLHLQPDELDTDGIKKRNLPPLPPNKTVLDVFADILEYLFGCARDYICENYGERLWTSVEDCIEFVLSHLTAGEDHSKRRCDQKGVMVVDAGGGTVDISSYSFTSLSPISVEEIETSCILQGSIRVNIRAEKFVQERLRMSEYGDQEDIDSMMKDFDSSTKREFQDEDKPAYIEFGSTKCNDPNVDIHRGQLTLKGSDMVFFFQPSQDAILSAILKQWYETPDEFSLETICLVGGFAASPWLYSSLKDRLNELDLHLTLYRPDSQTSKAVAIGAVSFYIDNFVKARVMQFTYGIEVQVNYDASDPDHYARRHTKYTTPSGREVVNQRFSTILEKGTVIRDREEVFKQHYFRESHSSHTLNSISTDVICYRGESTDPEWMDIDPELYTPLCEIYADTSQVYREEKLGAKGVYYKQSFKIVLLCGMTELQAQFSWLENGIEKRGPAQIIYDDDLEDSD
ncbi:hypothetical protein C8Q74DRAFT_1452763 [Fomes fomentarius]|nr:hypothetical protein C8Q74DRAFT_1452763 [Fomes fomentarius]